MWVWCGWVRGGPRSGTLEQNFHWSLFKHSYRASCVKLFGPKLPLAPCPGPPPVPGHTRTHTGQAWDWTASEALRLPYDWNLLYLMPTFARIRPTLEEMPGIDV